MKQKETTEQLLENLNNYLRSVETAINQLASNQRQLLTLIKYFNAKLRQQELDLQSLRSRIQVAGVDSTNQSGETKEIISTDVLEALDK